MLIYESEKEEKEVVGSTSKKQKACQDITNRQVVEASLNWPQMD